jgi:RNA polymerase sigma factor (sigma-70 family)
MAPTQGAVLLRQIRKLVTAQCPSRQPDLHLLQQFITEHSEVAFTALVERHEALVLGVARSVLHHEQDAEDVFQATFLVLARKAHTIRKQQSLSSWLHGVACRLALKARGRAKRWSDAPVADVAATASMDDLSWRELRGVLQEELQRLPDKYRAPLLLCYWEGKTRDEAAVQLGMTANAFKKYLERARNLLRSRLVRRGLAPSAALFATLVSEMGARGAVSASLTAHTVQAAVEFAAGQAIAAESATAAALAQGAIGAMNMSKRLTTILVALVVGGVGSGLGLVSYQSLQGQQPTASTKAAGTTGEQPAQTRVAGGEKTDQERFVGVWRFSTARSDGKDIAELKTLARFVFTANGKATLTVASEGKEGRYKLVGPRQIDLALETGKDLVPGIYKFEKADRLTLCFLDGRGGAKRPTEFSADKGSGQVLFVLDRAKPGEEKLTEEEVAKAKGAIDKVREAAARTMSANNLKQIGVAFHNYHDANNAFPAYAIYDKSGKTPLLSWRVALLPYLDQDALYQEFKLDEPWNSTHNKKLLGRMPKVFEIPSDGKKKEGLTHYQVFTGPGTLFMGNTKIRLTDITDGTSNTLLVLEAKDPVAWTKPADLTLPKDKDKIPAVGGHFSNGFNILLCDGSVRFLPLNPSPKLLRAIVTPAGGEVIEP